MKLNYKQIARFRAISKAMKNKKLKIEANAKENKQAMIDALVYAQTDLKEYLGSLPANDKNQKELVQISIDNLDATIELLESYELRLIEKSKTKQTKLER